MSAFPVKSPVTLPVTFPVTFPVKSPVTLPVTFPVKPPVTFPVKSPVMVPLKLPSVAKTSPCLLVPTQSSFAAFVFPNTTVLLVLAIAPAPIAVLFTAPVLPLVTFAPFPIIVFCCPVLITAPAFLPTNTFHFPVAVSYTHLTLPTKA